MPTPDPKLSRVIHVNVDPKVARRLRELAKQEDLTISQIIRKAVNNFLATIDQPQQERVA